MNPTPDVERTTISELLDVQQRQIVDLQERVTSLERTPAGERPAGGGLDVVPLVVKLVGAVARAAADAGGQGGEVPAPPKLGERMRQAQAAAEAAKEATARVRQAPVDEPTSLFPIAEPEPAAPFAGRTAPRRTLPPEAPVRLWNREHTDHLDVIGRAVPTPGKTRVRIRDDQVDAVRAWLAPLIEPDDAGPVYVAWMDREWSLAGYAGEYGAEHQSIKLDLLPLPKPPRVDAVLRREPATRREALDQATRESVDEVLPMPGGPNDKLSKADRPAVPCCPPAERAPDALHFQTGNPFTGYADLYARLDAIHDATAEEES